MKNMKGTTNHLGDTMVIFKRPLYLYYFPCDEKEEWTYVYGVILPNEHHPSTVDAYIAYLHACDNFLRKGNHIFEGFWELKDGTRYKRNKALCRLVESVQDLDYKVVLDDHPIEIKDGETTQDWIIKKDLIERVCQDLH